jgi:hypothetical protein
MNKSCEKIIIKHARVGQSVFVALRLLWWLTREPINLLTKPIKEWYFDIFQKPFFSAFLRRPIWNFLGNRFVDAHIRGNAQAKETELVEIGIGFAILP